MNQFQQIAEGFYNNITNKQQDLYKERIKICRKCKLLKIDDIFGEVCNSKLWINPETDETSTVKKKGFINGCGCILSGLTRKESSKCVMNKW